MAVWWYCDTNVPDYAHDALGLGSLLREQPHRVHCLPPALVAHSAAALRWCGYSSSASSHAFASSVNSLSSRSLYSCIADLTVSAPAWSSIAVKNPSDRMEATVVGTTAEPARDEVL